MVAFAAHGNFVAGRRWCNFEGGGGVGRAENDCGVDAGRRRRERRRGGAAGTRGGIEVPQSGSVYARRRRWLREGNLALGGRYFEGWLFRLSLAEACFSFMYSIERAGWGAQEKGVIQVLGADGAGARREIVDNGAGFGGEEEFLSVRHWTEARKVVGERAFRSGAGGEGYQLTSWGCAGRMRGDRGGEWNVRFRPVIGWGGRGGSEQRCTGTWLSYLPVFDVGWQVLMGHGLGEGWVEWGGKRWDFGDARVYSEKNWGTGFPRKWWWVQCNRFEQVDDLSVTAAGGVRQIGVGYEEENGLIGVHFGGNFYEFANWCCEELSWKVAPWGRWEARAQTVTGYEVRMLATVEEEGTYFSGPGTDRSEPEVRDAPYGEITLWLYGPVGEILLDGVRSKLAQVEVGGEKWREDWVASRRLMSQPLRGLVNAFNGAKVKTSM